jgi:hypothetical protein
MDVKEDLRKLEQRRQNYLSIVQDLGRKRFEREMAQGDLEMVETKIAELRKRMSWTPRLHYTKDCSLHRG